MKKDKGFLFIELFIVIVICALILAIVLPSAINGSPGTGEKIGQVVKLSKQGMFCKTWEGQLIRGGMTGGSGIVGTVPFDFTVVGEEMARQVQDYMRNQAEVTITYEIEGVYSPCRSGSHGYFLKSIQAAPKRN